MLEKLIARINEEINKRHPQMFSSEPLKEQERQEVYNHLVERLVVMAFDDDILVIDTQKPFMHIDDSEKTRAI